MAGLSLVTLVLGLLREFMIARELRASGDADLFFRGLVVINTARMFGMALFRGALDPRARVGARRRG
jgi:peptidoglycan biosynthesis protein MviN/MurJ (putative lipid II flippase)